MMTRGASGGNTELGAHARFRGRRRGRRALRILAAPRDDDGDEGAEHETSGETVEQRESSSGEIRLSHLDPIQSTPLVTV